MGIEDHQNQIGDLGQIADDFLVIVSAIPLGNAVKHPRRVDNGQGFQERRIHFFQAKVSGKSLPMLSHGLKRIFRVVDQKLAVPFFNNMNVRCFGYGIVKGDHGKRIIGRRLAGGLNVCS